MFNQDFYFQTIRKYVAMFGTLFSEINISRHNEDGDEVVYMRVPITYSQSEKMLTRVEQAVDGDRASLAFTLPVMSFEMTGLTYDPERKLQTSGRAAYLNVSTPSRLKYQYNPVPYNMDFQLNIWVKNVEDGTKIVEQILPYFTPEFTIAVQLIPELDVTQEVPIILKAVHQRNPYESEFKKNQPIIWTLDFVVKGNFWGPVKSGPIILFANTNMHIANSGTVAWSSVYPGQDANGNPTSNPGLTVAANTILANSDFGYITVYGQPDTIDGTRYIRSDNNQYTDDSTFISID